MALVRKQNGLTAYHVPEKASSAIPAKLDLFLSQPKNPLIPKIFLLITSKKEEIIKESDDTYFIPGTLLSDTLETKTGLATAKERFGKIARVINDEKSELTTSLDNQRAEIMNLNSFKISEEDQITFFGKKYGDTIFAAFQQITIVRSGLRIMLTKTMSGFIERLKTGLLNSEDLIYMNVHDVLRFNSPYALQLYFFIAKNQLYSNYVDIGVIDLANRIQIKTKDDGVNDIAFILKTLRRIVLYPELAESTCSLLKVPGTKNSYFEIIEKDNERRAKTIRLYFRSNEELAAELLNLDYPFIKHLKATDYNRMLLVRLIASVKDGLLEEKYVNFVINKTWESLQKDAYKKSGKIINAHFKKQDYGTSYNLYPDEWVLSDTPGVPITEILSKKKQPKQNFDNAGQSSFINNLKLLPSLPTPYIDYIQEMELEGQLEKKMSRNKMTDKAKVTYIKEFVYHDFEFSFIDAIKKAIFQIYDKDQIVTKVIDQLDNTILGELFGSFDIHNNSILLSQASKKALREHINEYINI